MGGRELNLYDDGDWVAEREREGWRWRRKRAGAELIGARLYELEPGQRTFPYHYEYGNEEWLLCVSGRPTLRTPEGERELREGDLVRFPEGPDGAHQVTNRTDTPVRVLIASTLVEPGVAVYVDSDKVGVWDCGDESWVFPRSAAVDYFEGEE